MKLRAATVALAAVFMASAQEAVIRVNAAHAAAYRIPRTIFGTFLEPIGNSIYGGLSAQILENPSFEENLWSAGNIRRMLDDNPALVRASQLGLPLPWEPLAQEQGARYEPRWNDAANSYRSLLIMALPGQQTGVRQQVYLPVHRVLAYHGSLYAKQVNGPATIEVSLRKRNQPEHSFARAQIPVQSTSWERYEFKLDLPPGQLRPLEPADFVLALSENQRALVDEVFLLPADHVDGMDREMIDLAKALKTPVVRFGGNFTSAYHWRDGVGPVEKRVSMLNLSWGIPEYNHFGTDEFLRFCKRIGAEPQIALNLGTGTPEEAAAWVRYVDEHWGKSGLLWELGNELWGDFQTGYPTLPRVAALTKAFSDAVRAVDPGARLIATGADPDHFEQWNAAQLQNAPGAFQWLSTHFVVRDENVLSRRGDPAFVALSAFALPVELERRLRSMRRQIDGMEAARGKVGIAFTEWLFHGADDRVPRFNNMGGAICAAGMLNTLMRVADFVPISDMTGLVEFGGIWKKRGRVYGVPAYWAFRMYSNADATTPVEVSAASETYEISRGNNRLPEIKAVPYLDVFAARNEAGTKLTLFCVNRDLDRDWPARIEVSGFAPGRSARLETLATASIYRANSEMQPEAVYPMAGTLAVNAPTFVYTFPRSSVTVIELPGR